jgi:hypothetical protein
VELSAHLFFPLIPFRLLALYGSAFNHTLDELFGRLLRSSEKPGLLNAPLLLEKKFLPACGTGRESEKKTHTV